MRRILGIDPGLASTGVGIIEESGDSQWRVVEAHEVKTSSSMALPKRLKRIHDLVRETIDKFEPQVASIETVFFAENVRSAILMSHGRGAAVLAAANSGIPVFEYSPLEIKQSVVGKGRASKAQVMHMVRVLLSLPELPMSDHQADALACALAHVYRSRMQPQLDASSAEAEKGTGEVNPAKALLAQARRGRRR